MSKTAYFFDRFCLDMRRGALVGVDGQDITLRPKSLSMLIFLIENSGRLLGREDLMQAIWPDTTVADEGIAQCIRDIRRALGDAGQQLIRTVPKRGYVFAADVAPYDGSDTPTPRLDYKEARPTVIVLPFRFSTAHEEYLAAGLTEELTTALARVRSLAIFSASVAAPLAAAPAVAAEYAIEGRLLHSGRRIRVTVRLVAMRTQTVLWANRYDGDASEMFGFHEKVTAAITGAVETYLLADETERILDRNISALDSRDLFLRALVNIQRQTVLSTSDAVTLLRRATVRDPGYGPAPAMLSMCLLQQMAQGWRAYHPDAIAETLGFAQQALAADPHDALVLGVAGFVPTWLAGNHELGAELSARATSAGKHSVMILAMTGAVSSIGGDTEEAVGRLERAIQLDQASPIAARLHTNLAGAHFFAGRYDLAVQWARRALAATPDYTVARLYLVAALGLQGDTAAVQQAVAEVQARQVSELPHWPGRIPFRHSWMQEMLDDGLRRGGLGR
ncbi:MAG TPA: winged helix-turn-helix domain-containing protein [Acetobacteraceae bacterium]|nr:winged helix-turn-helix domain-containing protein [Acetobacteraceae bacterium]